MNTHIKSFMLLYSIFIVGMGDWLLLLLGAMVMGLMSLLSLLSLVLG